MSHNAKAMVVTCMDFRLLNNARNVLKDKGYDLSYDQFVIAGVSLGFLQPDYTWGKSLIDHIKMSIKLHGIKEVILIDHLDCGAYKTFIKDLKPENEREEHVKNLKKAVDELSKEFKDLKFTKWILSLDGKVEVIQ